MLQCWVTCFKVLHVTPHSTPAMEKSHLASCPARTIKQRKDRQAEPHNYRKKKKKKKRIHKNRNPCNSFLMVKMASSMDHGRVRPTTTTTNDVAQHGGHPANHAVLNYSIYYSTAIRRVQITPETSTNITRYLYSRGPVRHVSCR